jgi:exonuclease SbcC
MITSLILKNWRTHKETELEFGKGTNVIVGVMGSGKSSIVNAISYSLFGTFPAAKNRSIALEEIIMNKPNEEKSTQSTLNFGQNGKQYSVERIIKKDGTNEAKLYEGNKLIAGPKQKDVNEKIENILGLNYELFSRAVYSEQNEMDFFLKLSPGERKKKFDELLELEKYEEARKNSVTLQNDLLKEKKQEEEFIKQQKETIKNHEEEKTAEKIKEEEKAIIEIEKELFETKKKIVLAEKELVELMEKEKQNKNIEETILKGNSKIEMLKEEIAKGEKILLKEILDEAEKLKKEAEEKKIKLAVIEKECKEKDAEMKKLGEEARVKEYEKKKLAEEEKAVNSLTGKCPTCKRELDEKHKEELKKEITQKLGHILAGLEENLKNKKIAEEKLKEFEKERETLRKEIDEKNKAVYLLEAKQKQAQELEQKKKTLENLNTEMPKLKKQLLEIGFDKKKLENAREETYKLKSNASINETKIKSKQELKKNYEETMQKITLIKKNVEEREKNTVKKENAAQKLGIFANCLKATQTELRESMLETINQAMTTIWQTTYPYKDFTDARLCVTPEGYDLQVRTRNNEWTRVEGILSGGERSAAALCIRIAFALVLTKKLSMLILDEPTHNLDTNAVGKLSEMLREELPKIVEQIFVITHDKQLENAASSNLYLLTRNKNTDETTKTEMLNFN